MPFVMTNIAIVMMKFVITSKIMHAMNIVSGISNTTIMMSRFTYMATRVTTVAIIFHLRHSIFYQIMRINS